ncbi:MAG: hypothetical protein B7X35_09550 [Halothiobacillus sp. 14-56-357]|nr:MAG: hypothetical protein B7X44_00800 [Halothiobacillus sp. 15-55-196]OZB55100.1 MAG: hypothetical protein B7X35_09550 [Halothiobacillus sp. 14-56-357]OZB79420.1 MAG: hypothetical protein B7X29_00715 [Halothiobacillus sp. 13-55-115]
MGTSKNLLNAGLRLLRIDLAAARAPIAALGGANAKLASARYGFSRYPGKRSFFYESGNKKPAASAGLEFI